MNPQILRLSTGFINQINDAAIGQSSGPLNGLGSSFAGQLGKLADYDDDNIRYNAAIGTVFGGRFQYVRLAAAASAVVIGQIVFWDISVADSLYQVTTVETGSTDGAMFRAGIVLYASWAAGNYGVIQVLGPTYVKFRGTLTSAGAAGSRVYAAAAGAGADNGFADVLSSAGATSFADVSKMQGRYIGTAVEAPAGGGLKLVNVNFTNVRG